MSFLAWIGLACSLVSSPARLLINKARALGPEVGCLKLSGRFRRHGPESNSLLVAVVGTVVLLVSQPLPGELPDKARQSTSILEG